MIKEDEQERSLTEAYLECFLKQEDAIETDTLVYCPITFDSITCWPQAQMNETISLPCANYVNKFNTRRMFILISFNFHLNKS